MDQTKEIKKEIDNLNAILRYIRRYWSKVTCYRPQDKQLHLGLPNKYISPNNEIFKNDQFYWDSYFTIVGLMHSDKRNLAKGMVENFAYLFRRFGIIPMRNRYYNLGTSQIPFLTSMIFEVYPLLADKRWLKKVIAVAEKELSMYWMNESLTEKHIVYNGLSRYCDHFITHLGAEHESGWDMTSRFNDRCLDYLPVDLNCCLFKYETDIANAYKLLGDNVRYRRYVSQAKKRKVQVNKLMWNEEKNFFFDFNKTELHQSKFYSVAGFYPLWSKLASEEQAEEIVKRALPLFEHSGGIVNTLNRGLKKDFRQHDFPNGWPHQQYIVVKGLLNYGYLEDARRIAMKWLQLNSEVFSNTGKLWEKYDVVGRAIGKFNPDRYVTQSGFAWTNAVFLWMVKTFLEANITNSDE